MNQDYRRLDCPKCQKRLKINPDWNPEKKVKCPGCEHSFRLTAKPASNPAKPAEPASNSFEPFTPPGGSKKLVLMGISICGILLLVLGLILGSRMGNSNASQGSLAQAETNTAPDKTTKTNNEIQKIPAVTEKPDQQVVGTTNNVLHETAKPKAHPDIKQTSQAEPNEVAEKDDSKEPEFKVKPGEFGLGLECEVDGEFDDPNRPQFNPNAADEFELDGFEGGFGPTGGLTQDDGQPSDPTGEVPALNVLIEPEVKSSSVMRVDYQSDPGISAKFTVTLDKAPISTITIKITTEQGLTVDEDTLTFAANTSPKRQTVTVSGDGKANLERATAKILYMTVTASGGGFDATGPAKVPVQVVKRTGWVAANGNWLDRGDSTGQGEKTEWFSHAFPGKPATGTEDHYTHEFVEVMGPKGKLRARFYADRAEIETAPNSKTFKHLANGNWF